MKKLKNLVTTYVYDNRGMNEHEIDNIIDYFVHAPNFVKTPLTEEEIDNVRKQIHADYLIKLDLGTSITAKDFVPWFMNRKKTLNMGYWNRYKEYLLRDKNIEYKEILEPFIIDEYNEMLANNKHNINYCWNNE